MTIKGIALNEDFSICSNGVVTLTNLTTEMPPVTASTNGNGYFEVYIDQAGEWSIDKIITSEIVEID